MEMMCPWIGNRWKKETEKTTKPEPVKFLRGTSKNFERKVKFLEYFFSPSRDKSVKKQRDPKPHISNTNTVTFH